MIFQNSYVSGFPQQLDKIGTDLGQIESQRGFDQNSKLTYLAVLYVPLSFVTVGVLSRGFAHFADTTTVLYGNAPYRSSSITSLF